MRRGTRVGQAYVALAVDGSGVNEEIVDSVGEAGPGVEKEGEDHGERYSEGFDRGSRSRMGAIFDKVSDAARRRFGIAGSDAGDDMGRSLSQRLLDKTKDLGDRAAQELGDRIASRSKSVQSGIERAFSDDFVSRVGDRVGAQLGGHLVDALNFALSREGGDGENPLADLFDRWMNDAVSGNRSSKSAGGGKTFGDRIGAIFGAGSRNNFLNVIGESVGGIINLVSKVGSSAQTMFSVLRTGFAETEEGAGGLSRAMSGLGGTGTSALSSFAAAAPAAIAGSAAIAVALVVLISVASALLATITALAATIASALVGALTIGAGALGAVAAAAGLLTIAFTSLTDKQIESLKTAFRPLKAEITGLGQLMLQDLVPAFDQWSIRLQRAAALAAPLASVMGGAFAEAGNRLASSLSGPGFQMLLATLAVYLPDIVTHLSSALGQFLNGMAGVFSALLPYVLQFSEYLQRVATDFAAWATSAEGQNAIVDWVGRALGALRSLWDFLGAIGGLITTVLFGPDAQNAGNSIFDSMTAAVKRFTNYIGQDNRLEKWFATGIAMAIALGKTIEAIGKILSWFNESGVISGIGALADVGEKAVDWFSRLPQILQDTLVPLKGVADLIGAIGKVIGAVTGSGSSGSSHASSPNGLADLLGEPLGMSGSQVIMQSNGGSAVSDAMNDVQKIMDSLNSTMSGLQSSGTSALNATSVKHGGYIPKQWQNPYIAYANSIMKKAPSIAATIKNAMRTANETIAKAINSGQATAAKAIMAAAQSTDASSVKSALDSLVESQSASFANTIETLKTNAKNTVQSAKDALNSAASSLASATTQKAANKALKAVQRAQKGLKEARGDKKAIKAETKEMKEAIKNANAILKAQGVVDKSLSAAVGSALKNYAGASSNDAIVNMLRSQNATLATYADARSQVAEALQAANQKLADAIQLRDSYQQQVAQSVESFGSLLTAQAQTINGVTQALTATDITSNLQERLTKIKTFNDNLRILLAEGLSNDAYKQLVDAGVDGGSDAAAALVQGGVGAVAQVNSLTGQIKAAGDALGTEASNRLYQAGVDAAQGLVDGLTSLSAQLDSAAAALGTSIANAIKRELGIASPSKVLIGMMDFVGDGAVIGLDNQKVKVSAAAGRFADSIAVSPEVAAYAARQGQSPTVSGNPNQKIGDVSLTVVTPTKDPKAAAQEAINELVGRL